MMQPGAMKARGREGKESFLEENPFDNGQDFEGEGPEDFSVPECRVVVPPPSHVMCERAVLLEKQRESTSSWNPECRRLVDRMLLDVYMVLQPTKEQRDARRSVIQFVDSIVKQRIHESYITVFGSYVMDLFTGSSDLDLSLNVGRLPVDRTRADRIANLRKLTRILYGLLNGRNGMTRFTVRKIEPVMRAAVPVVKFVEGHTNIECDISMENKDGILKSELIAIFTQIDPRFRQLCFLLKAWAKAYNVNDSKKGTLNSLSIILLAAFHLQIQFSPTCFLNALDVPSSSTANMSVSMQTRSPAILPSFSALLEGLVLQETEACIAAVKERVALYVMNCFGSDNKETLSQLFGSFFIKFVAVESLWEQGLCASVYEGKWVSKVWAKNHLGCMSVEDFAERSQNCARAVREKEFDTIHQCFRDTLSHLDQFTGGSSQILEIQETLFGVKVLKRTSEEPLVQPVEKHLKVSNNWTSSVSNPAPYVGRDHLNGFAVRDPYGTTHPYHSNHNRDLNFSRQQRGPFQGYQEFTGWAAQGENIRATGRGIISSIPGGQGPHFADSNHDQVRPPRGSQSFPQQIHHSQMRYPAYNAQAEIRPLNYTARGQDHPGNMRPRMGGPGMGAPLLYPPYPRPQAYYADPVDQRSDARRDHDARQSPNWRYNQSPQGDHASQAFAHRNNR